MGGGGLIISFLQFNSLKSHITTCSYFIHVDRKVRWEGKGIDSDAGQEDLPSPAAFLYKAT